MNQMTLSRKHRIQNSSPGDQRLGTLPLCHHMEAPYITESLRVSGEGTFPGRQL